MAENGLGMHAPTDVTDPQQKAATFGAMAVWCLTVWAGFVLSRTASQPVGYPLSFALSASWLIMAFTAAFTSKSFHARDPRRIRFAPWEREGTIYRFVGLGIYRRVLLRSPFAWLAPELRLRTGRSDLVRMLREINAAEGPHAIAGILTLVFAAFLFGRGHTNAGLWVLLINLPLNIYPVMLQRWNRGRVYLLMRRLKP